MSDPLVRIEGVTKLFGDTVAVKEVSLVIGEGEFVVLLGPSGSGKTTLLNILAGFVEPTSGRVLISGEDMSRVPPARRPTTTVFQDYALFPHMSVARNVAFGLAMRGVPGPSRRQRSEAALELVGLGGFGRRRVHELSGGQRQRVALARAIVVDPEVLLLDEPLGALDLNLRRQMQEELLHLQRYLGTTFVHVTHDQDEAMNIADTIVVLNEGRVEDQGPPARIYLKPATRFVATFMGDSNLVEGTITQRRGEGAIVETALGVLELPVRIEGDGKVVLSLRPEQIVTAPGDGLTGLGVGVVTECHFNGTHVRCHLTAGRDGAGPLTVHLPARAAVCPGDRLGLYVDPADVVVLAD